MSRSAVVHRLAFDFTIHPAASPFKISQKAYLATQSSAKCGYIATGALVFDIAASSEPRILLLQRAASDSMPNKWEIPGGGCDDEDETILHAVARELWEEAGLKATRIGGPVGSPHFFTSRSGKKIAKFNFNVQAEPNAEGRFDVKIDPEEHQRFVWASEREVKAKRSASIDLEFTTKDLENTILMAFEQFQTQ